MSESKPDLLNREPFIEGLCETLKKTDPTECQIIAIEGGWGAGKTFVIDQLRTRLKEENRIIWMDFNPWSFKDKDHLTSLFFAELKNKLPVEEKNYLPKLALFCALSALAQSAALYLFKKYSIIEDFIFLIAPYVRNFLMAVVLFCLPVLLWMPETRQKIPEVWKWIKPLLSDPKDLIGLISQYADLLEGNNPEKSERPLTEVKKEISEALKNCDQFDRIIVAIEDLDRLTPKEVCDVIQFVGMIADFDKITYLLAYDRDQVVCALGSLSAANSTEADHEEYGAGFLRRVVERSIPLPEIDRARLTSIMIEEYRKALALHYPNSWQFRGKYWNRVSRIVFSLCATLRDAERVISHAWMVAKYIKDYSNPADVLLCSYLHIFEPKAWERLQKNFLYYHAIKDIKVSDHDEYKKSKEFSGSCIRSVSEFEAKALLELLNELSPRSPNSTLPANDSDFWMGDPRFFNIYKSYTSTSLADGVLRANRLLAVTGSYDDFNLTYSATHPEYLDFIEGFFACLTKRMRQELADEKGVGLLKSLARINKDNHIYEDLFTADDARHPTKELVCLTMTYINAGQSSVARFGEIANLWLERGEVELVLMLIYSVILDKNTEINSSFPRIVYPFSGPRGLAPSNTQPLQETFEKVLHSICEASEKLYTINRIGIYLALWAKLSPKTCLPTVSPLLGSVDLLKHVLQSMTLREYYKDIETGTLSEVISHVPRVPLAALFSESDETFDADMERLISRVIDDPSLVSLLREVQKKTTFI